ncbi:MAG: hypothetical protein KF810_23015 [Rhizobiaceae bacterium]|nr:hypothetical protein [Rhizobiaceae bacterium]
MSEMRAHSPTVPRYVIEAEIERLIALLDAMDPDPDLEPWLTGELAPGDTGDDREEECEDEGGQCDDEGVIESGIADEDALLADFREEAAL